jgi:hypothetical protein
MGRRKRRKEDLEKKESRYKWPETLVNGTRDEKDF